MHQEECYRDRYVTRSTGYSLGRKRVTFLAQVGLDDTASEGLEGQVKVFIDGQRELAKPVTLGHPVSINLPVANAVRLKLEVTFITKNGCRHSDEIVWGDARLVVP